MTWTSSDGSSQLCEWNESSWSFTVNGSVSEALSCNVVVSAEVWIDLAKARGCYKKSRSVHVWFSGGTSTHDSSKSARQTKTS